NHTDPNATLLECFDVETNTCPILPACALRQALYKAQKAFMDVLASYSLADVLQNKTEITMLLDMPKT
ncbi:MAG: Rrf2 family transcriptional regulator, partial [Mariprofundus sp.]|nr:Rrf2 family transcriptional regulator [Mariprofundus sp.]